MVEASTLDAVKLFVNIKETMTSLAHTCPDTPEKDEDALDFIELLTTHAKEVQDQVLRDILSKNSTTEYLLGHGLDGNTDGASFKRTVPIVTYEDLKPFIQRIANGDTSAVLCSTPVSEFLTSSGTSAGQRKLMPTIHGEMDRKQLLYNLLIPVMNKYVKNLDRGKGMYFYFVKAESKTPGGLPARPVLTSYYRSKHFQEMPYNAFRQSTSPLQAVLCTDVEQSMYSQMLCGLAQRKEVLRMGAVFASGLLRAIHYLQNHWQELCKDIRSGTVSEERVQDPAVREAVCRIVKADPALAEQIERECSGKSWQGILKRIWPNTVYMDVVVTGAMAQYRNALDFYSGGLPQCCTMYASSECYFGINLEPMAKPAEVSYTLLPCMGFYEFIPVQRDEAENCRSYEPQQPVDLVDVEIGRHYELVVTTYAGLYRYRMGDILKVTGFHNNAPQFSFVCRKNVALSIDSDKTDEVELHSAVTRATKELEQWGVSLVEYTSRADTTTMPGHYVLYWELSGSVEELPQAVMESCCAEVEEHLNSVYRQCRSSDKSIGPLEIRVVKTGTFDRMMDYAISNGSSVNQYKAPRCITSKVLVELLDADEKARFFSPRAPSWKPRSHWD